MIPASYAKRFADGITGFSRVQSVADAGHMLEIDQPAAAAAAVLEFFS